MTEPSLGIVIGHCARSRIFTWQIHHTWQSESSTYGEKRYKCTLTEFCQTNILISPSGRACLADIYKATDTTRRITGTPIWQAPELLINLGSEDNSQLNTRAVDIYAFGMVCYEVREFSLTLEKKR
jgi:hypothetical protein